MSASKVVKKIVSISVSILIMILIVAGLYQGGRMAYDFGYRVFTEPAISTPEESVDKVVQISSKMEAKELGDLLEQEGLIRNAGLFSIQLKLSSYSAKIKDGTYTLSTSMTAHEMMRVMSAEEIDDTESEDWNVEDIEAEDTQTTDTNSVNTETEHADAEEIETKDAEIRE